MKPTVPCGEEGCDRPAVCRGMCHKHYARARWRAMAAGTWSPGESGEGRGWHGDPEGHSAAGKRAWQKNPAGSERMAELGRMGGAALVAKYGREHMAEMGRRYGEIAKQKYGPEHFRELGLRSAHKRWGTPLVQEEPGHAESADDLRRDSDQPGDAEGDGQGALPERA